MSRRVLINLCVFLGVFFVMLWWAINNVVTVDLIERPYTIQGEFAQAAGVRKDAEVTYLGVHYGRVSSVTLRDQGVTITMKIDREKHIPKGSIAQIFRKSAIGEPYIDFKPPDGPFPTEVIEPGEGIEVAEEQTTVPLEFSELLRSASALVGSIDPDAAGSLVHELALALDGRGQDLRDLTIGFDTITATFAARTDELDRLAENSTRITRVLADHRLSIGQSLANLRAVGDSLRNSTGDLGRLFEDGPAFLRTTADLVADQKRNLDCLLTDLAPVLHLAGAEHADGLRELLQNGPQGFGYVYSAVDREADGPWIRVNLAVPVGGTDPKVYTPRATLPVVPTISPCGSTMTPASVFPAARPGTSSGPERLPATLSSSDAAGYAAVDPFDAAALLREPADLSAAGAPPAPTAAILAFVTLAGAIALLATRRRTPTR